MRVHRLQVQAFGPFGGTEEVDFEPLNAAGLFLLDGPTGAGKSSVLAAICFALYGVVPGGRSVETIASTHAEPGVRPEALVEVTLGGRRFEILRWLRYQRPKKRRSASGSELTWEQSGAQLREWREGQWQEVSTRADEIGQLLSTVLALDSQQFMHVVMLPQGQFAQFLRAGSKEKETLLRRLFGTERFEDVERHLAQTAQRLAEGVRQDQVQADRVRDDLQDALAELPAALPEAAEPETTGLETSEPETAEPDGEDSDDAGADGADSDGADSDGAVPGGQESDADLADRALDTAERAWAQGQRALEQARTLEARSQQALVELQDLDSSLRAARKADQRQQSHAESAEAAAQARDQVEAHQAVESVVRRADEAEQSRQVLSAAQTRWTEHRERLAQDEVVGAWEAELSTDGTDLAAGDPAAAETHLDALRRQADRELLEVQRHQDQERRRRELRRVKDQHLQEQQEHRSQLAADQERLQTAREAAVQAAESVESLGGAEEALTRAERALEQALARREAARTAQQLGEELEAAETRLRAATDRAQQARDHWQGLNQLRLENSAALLAAALEDGVPCAVCGSPEHPEPASPTQSAPDLDFSPEALETAEEDWGRAQQQREHAQEQRDQAQAAHSQALVLAQGADLVTAEAALAAGQQEVKEARQRSKDLGLARAALQTAQKQQQTALDASQEHRSQLDRLEVLAVQEQQQLEELDTALGTALRGRPSLEVLQEQLTAARDGVEQARRAAQAVREAQATADRQGEALDGELARVELATVDAARAALLDSRALAQARARVEAWDREKAALAEVDQLPQVVAGRAHLEAGRSEPTQEQLLLAQETAGRARSAVEAASARTGTLESVRGQIRRAARTLRQLHERSAEQRQRSSEASALLDLVRGQGENELRMRLASYVLAGRLEEVAAAASERLVSMTDGRYELVHDDAGSGRGTRGLDLVVLDHHTDDRRHASTLSGGETFMASLALALGLADTVQAEAGGVVMDTLFVDEGFGSLDAETLEQVMDVLVGLQDGGRTLGLVSHVERLRQEIGLRLAVTKTREGSHLRVVLPGTPSVYAGQHAS